MKRSCFASGTILTVILAVFSTGPVFGNTITVTNTADSGPGSLRDAISSAASGDTINFSLGSPATITLASGALVIDKNLTIAGPGASALAISANNISQVFNIAAVTATISGVTIEGAGGGNGTGITNSGALTINSCSISGNYSPGWGGGIINKGTLTISNSTFSGNSAVTGGAIFQYSGTVTITATTFSGNSAGDGGGGAIYINPNAGLVTISNSTFFGNSANTSGAGAIANRSALTISFSTLSGNSAPRAAGISMEGSTTLKSTILANGSSSGGNCYVSGSVVSAGYNLSDDASCGFSQPTDLNNTPAGLDPSGLQNNGGPTKTIALLATSPAVNAIPVSPTNYCTDANGALVTTDQRGVTRPRGPACDISAFEFGQPIPVPFISQPLVPTAVLPGGSDFTLTLNGANFVSGSVVKWNGSALATTFVGPDQLTAAVPAADVTSEGTASITVVNPQPGVSASNVAYFEITNPTASVSFTRQDYGPAAFSIAIGDFNGDGKLDLAVVGFEWVGVLLGNGDGTFQAPEFYTVMTDPSAVAVGDFNGDGKLDLAVASHGGYVSVLLGNGDGTFQAPLNTPGGTYVLSLAVGDFNGDGKLEVALGDWYGRVGVLLGKGDGTFGPEEDYPVGTNAQGVEVGDFNGDGKPDLVVAGYSGYVSVLLGNDDGTFQGAVNYRTATYSASVAVADLNGDGRQDLAVSNPFDSNISVLLGNGDGTFQAAVNYATITPAGQVLANNVVAMDFNGDGKLDLATANQYANSVSLLLGNGDGTFQPTSNFALGTGPGFAIVGDFNGDGRMDLAVLNNATISILLQGIPVTATISPASLDFGHSPVGVLTGSQTVTVTNNGSAELNVSSVSASGDFSETDDCTSGPVAAGGTCTISMSFLPTAVGKGSGTLTIIDNAGDSPQSVSLGGIGDPAATILTVSAPSVTYGSPGSVTVSANSSAGTVTGNVSLLVDGGALVTQALSGGSTVFTLSGLSGGGHALTASYAAQSNFAAGSATGTITVNKAAPSITWANPADITYGTALSAAQLNATASVAGTFNYTPANGTVLNTGPSQSLSVNFTPADATDYSGATKMATINVNAAPLTVTANNATKVLDGLNPAFTATYSGFVLGQGPGVLAGTLTCTSTATTTSPVGSYPITCSGQSSSNYAIQNVAGTLKVIYAAAGGVCDGDLNHAILQPVNLDGSSVFKQGSTVPAKFRVCDANGVSVGTPGVVSAFKLVQTVNGTMVQYVDESVDSTTPDSTFRWDSTGQQWIFNIGSKSLAANQTYVFLITLNDGTTIPFQFGLK